MRPEGEPEQPDIVRLGMPAHRLAVAHHSGPGLRVIFWVQGCSLLCTHRCLNPHLLSRRGGYLVRAPELAEQLLRTTESYGGVEGVTVLGGEPFDQAAALALALRPLHAAGLSIMVYTGHVLEELQAAAAPGTADLLGLCDLLVDGPFVDSLHDPALIWRGSTNQRILRLSERYSEADLLRAAADQARAVFLSRSPAGDVIASGAQTPRVARGLRDLARELAGADAPGRQP